MRPAFSARRGGAEEEKKLFTNFNGNIPNIYPNLILAYVCKYIHSDHPKQEFKSLPFTGLATHLSN